MKTVEVNGRTVEEAISSGLAQLGVERDQVDIEIIIEPSKGFLGLIGQKDALVRITKIDTIADVVIELVVPLLNHYGLKAKTDVKTDKDQLYVSLTGADLGVLIGRRGDTLDSLQCWLNLAVNKKTNTRYKVILDIEGYRDKRRVILEKLAMKLAGKVKQSRRRVVLEPMNPYERSIIHNALQEDTQVQTFSEGDEPYRKVVIALKR